MDIYINLFSVSITLIGFVAVFLVFRYQTIDTHVDSRKPILRSLLETQIRSDPSIAIRIQDIGKDPQSNDAQFFSQFNNEAVNRFVNDVIELRIRRVRIVRFGLKSITIWTGLSLFYLISSCFLSNAGCSATMIGIAIAFFTGSLVFTLYFIFISILNKKPK